MVRCENVCLILEITGGEGDEADDAGEREKELTFVRGGRDREGRERERGECMKIVSVCKREVGDA